MSFRPDQLHPNIIKITPRRGIFGQNLAVWSTGHDYPIATFMWNIIASKAASNQAEIEQIVRARMEITGENFLEAYNALVLESGMFRLSENENTNDTLVMNAELVQAIRDAAAAEGISTADFLKQRLGL
ncbi:MAG: hypothetical protein KME46_29835 [Brasilonema angustatum HA4187-MV1]|jgi:hypothetical protein|nr:hypothetical protein [Brasilonema angustatum HA4187-MV1]